MDTVKLLLERERENHLEIRPDDGKTALLWDAANNHVDLLGSIQISPDQQP